jgi:hypothetical protein
MLPDVPKERTVSNFSVMSPWADPQPWRRRLDVASKLHEHIAEQHDATTQKNCFLYSHAAETSIHSFLIVKNMFRSDYFIFLVQYCVLLTHDWYSMKSWNDTCYRSNGTQRFQWRESREYSLTELLWSYSIIWECLSQKLKKRKIIFFLLQNCGENDAYKRKFYRLVRKLRVSSSVFCWGMN